MNQDTSTTIASTAKRLFLNHLKGAGYHTGLVGKWHCGATRFPKTAFDHWYSFWVWQYPHFGKQNFSNQGNYQKESGNQSHLLTNRFGVSEKFTLWPP